MQVVIHAGAAFTDEGGIMRSLLSNGEVLRQNGTVSMGPRRYKTIIKPVLDAMSVNPAQSDLVYQIRNQLPADPKVDRAIFSSPDYIGELPTAIHEGQFYPHAGQRMAILNQVFEDHQVELFLGLLNPGSFIPKVLMSLPDAQRNKITRNTDLSCLSWLSVIEDIRDLAPNVAITLWCNEDTPLIWGDLLRALGGVGQDIAIQDEHALYTSLLTDIGKREFLALIRQHPEPVGQVLRHDLIEILETHAQPDKVEEELNLPGWSTGILDAFSELYEQDLARLRTMPDIRFLSP